MYGHTMLNSFSFFKKGQGLPIETIIIILILIIVFVVIVVIFSNQSGSIFDTLKTFLGLANETVPKNLSEVIQ